VRELRALGLPGRARGVEERGDVAGRRGHGTDRVDAVELVRVAHHDGGLRVGHDMVDLVVAHLRVDGHGHRTGAAGGRAQQHEGVAVGCREHDAVAGRDLGLDGTGPTRDEIGGRVVAQAQPVVAVLLDQCGVAVHARESLEERSQCELVTPYEIEPVTPCHR
jgi:hypothetical protein